MQDSKRWPAARASMQDSKRRPSAGARLGLGEREMWKRRDSLICNENRCGCFKKHRLAGKQNLYLALDTGKNGINMYRIDKSESHGHLSKPFIHLDNNSGSIFTAMGSNIFIAANLSCEPHHTSIFIYHTDTLGLDLGPFLPAQVLGGSIDMAVAVADADGGEVLYVLASKLLDCKLQHYFEKMSWKLWAPLTKGRRCNPQKVWSWTTVSSKPPFGSDEVVTSYAVHPDGGTIFMTTSCVLGPEKGTYLFNIERCEWRWCGAWVLPFQGRGYYCSKLDAWVGLREDGYICSCKVPLCSTTCTDQPQLDWVMLEEKMFCKHFGEDPGRHFGATLTCMGENIFCLVEAVMHEGLLKSSRSSISGGSVHLTTFSLKHNEKGKLQASVHHPTYSYPTAFSEFALLGAFWL